MKKNFKRVLSAALVVVMLFTAFPAAFAFGSKETDYTIISPYEQGNIFNKDPRRPRRLLAHKAEIRRLGQQIKLQGYTLVPLSLYFKKGRVKLELGLCKGKKLYDKRASAAARDAKRDIDRALKTQR